MHTMVEEEGGRGSPSIQEQKEIITNVTKQSYDKKNVQLKVFQSIHGNMNRSNRVTYNDLSQQIMKYICSVPMIANI